MVHFILNNKNISTGLPPGMVMLDFLRYHQHLTGTKIGCREGDCGACTVLCGELRDEKVVYRSVTSCLMALGNANARHIVTIEGVNQPASLNPVQQAMSDESATQCGFCTPGIVMSLTGYCLGSNIAAGNEVSPNRPAGSVLAAVDGNICRCTGYKSIEKAARNVAALMEKGPGSDVMPHLIDMKVVPAYFNTVKSRLQSLEKSLENGLESAAGHNRAFTGKGRFLSGGTDLYVQQHEAMVHSDIRFLNTSSALRSISERGNECVIGSAVTITDLIDSDLFESHFPEIRRFIKLVSSTPIRNMATVGGNIVNASPIGDLTIFFMALDARLVLDGGEETRELPLRKLYTGYKTLAKQNDEYIREIRFEWPGKNAFFNFEKVSKRTHLDIASVNTAMCIQVEDNVIIQASISAGGVGPVPAFLSNTSAWFKGKNLRASVIHEAIGIAQSEISPISDTRGSARYKRLLLAQLIKAHFMVLFPYLKPDEMLFEQ